MTVLLDACAVIAFLRDEPGARDVEPLLADEHVATTAINVAEIVDKLGRTSSLQTDDIEATLAMLGLEVEPVAADMALAAGRLRSECYHHKDRPVSLADCIAVVAALGSGRRLATSDSHLARVADDLGVTVERLRDSKGKRPKVR